MLEGEHRCRHEHRHLLGVARRLERRTYRHFGLAETHVATHKAVHRSGRLHVGFHVVRGALLVGRVLVEERRLKLVLQVRVG